MNKIIFSLILLFGLGSLGFSQTPVIRTPELILSGNTTTVPLTVRGASGQTADLQDWQNNAGTNLCSLSAAGVFSCGGAAVISGSGTAGQVAFFSSANVLTSKSTLAFNSTTNVLSVAGLTVTTSTVTVGSNAVVSEIRIGAGGSFLENAGDANVAIGAKYSAGGLYFYTNGTIKSNIDVSGNFSPFLADNSETLGNIGARWFSVATPQIHSGASALNLYTGADDVARVTIGLTGTTTFNTSGIGVNVLGKATFATSAQNVCVICNADDIALGGSGIGFQSSSGSAVVNVIVNSQPVLRVNAGSIDTYADNTVRLGSSALRFIQGFFVTTEVGTTGTVGSLNVGGNFYWSGYPSLSTSLSGAVCMSATNLVEINTNAGGCLVSALKYKTNVEDILPSDALSLVLKMKPVTYDPKENLDDHQFGFIADWAESIDNRLVTRDKMGDVSGFRYEQYTAYLTGAIQAQEKRIQALEARN